MKPLGSGRALRELLLPLVPAVAVRESERANPGVPVVLRVNRKLTIGSDRKFPPGLVIRPGTAGPIASGQVSIWLSGTDRECECAVPVVMIEPGGS